MANKLVIEKSRAAQRADKGTALKQQITQRAKGQATISDIIVTLADLAEQQELILTNQAEILKKLI
ncbi:MAG: hypothetical protein C4562_01070 [Actinobacteria bacterium]|nr:MAG: hypothetical protein C4562_01070 [Actinomycetota bacterium]